MGIDDPKKNNIVVYKGVVADGARISQGFAIELPCMVKKFRELFEIFSIQLLYPVLELESDWDLKNFFLSRGFVPKTLEPQCLIGVPLRKEGELEEEIQMAVVAYFEKIILPRAKKLVEEKATLNIIEKMI